MEDGKICPICKKIRCSIQDAIFKDECSKGEQYCAQSIQHKANLNSSGVIGRTFFDGHRYEWFPVVSCGASVVTVMERVCRTVQYCP